MADRETRPLHIGLAGLGNVGAGVYKNLEQNRALLRERTGHELVVKKVAVRDPSKKRTITVPAEKLTPSWQDLVEDDEIAIIVELIGGTVEAFDLVRAALAKRKIVVTGNKALLAERGQELFALAEEYRTPIYFEAAVAGGIPIIKTVQESFVGNHIQSIVGIINGTSNFILTRMTEAGLSYTESLKEAQDLGYAEADPALDVNGWDAAHKAILLASLSYGCWVKTGDIHVEGIENVTQEDIVFADYLGYTIKLLAVIQADDSGSIEVRVQPSLISSKHILASVQGVFNAIAVHGDIVGETLFYGSGAGQDPTSSSVLSDLVDAASGISTSRWRSGFVPHGLYGKPLPIADTISEYYLRLSVDDRPGVLAQIARILGDHEIGISSVIQPDSEQGATATLVLLIHFAPYGTMLKAVDRIAVLPCVEAKPALFRVESL